MKFGVPAGPAQVITTGGTQRIVANRSAAFANAGSVVTISVPLAATDASITVYASNASGAYDLVVSAQGAATGNFYGAGELNSAVPQLGAVVIPNTYGTIDPMVTLTITVGPGVTAFPLSLTITVVALPTDQYRGAAFPTYSYLGNGTTGPVTILPANSPPQKLRSVSSTLSAGPALAGAQLFVNDNGGHLVHTSQLGASPGYVGDLSLTPGSSGVIFNVVLPGPQAWFIVLAIGPTTE